jgi:DNA-binding beta-propeller fold protein YncE
MRMRSTLVGWCALFAAGLTLGGCSASLPSADGRPVGLDVVVVANQEHGVATLVDLSDWRVAAHVDVLMDPHEAAASPDGRLVALASPSTWMGDANRISLLDVGSARLERTLDLGSFRWPHGLAFVDARTLVVSSRAQGGIAFVDIESGRVLGSAHAPGSTPYLLQLAASTGRIYTSSPDNNTLAEFDLKRRAFVRQYELPEPAGFAVSPDGRTLWISTGSGDGDGKVVVIDAQTGGVRNEFPLPGRGRRIAFAGADRVLVTDVLDGSVRVFDAESLRDIGRIAWGEDTAPSGISCDAAARRCYVATLRSGELVEIDVNGMRVLRRLQVGVGADGVVFARRAR